MKRKTQRAAAAAILNLIETRPPRPVGRPAFEGGVLKTCGYELTKAHKYFIDDEAARLGLSRSAYMRAVIDYMMRSPRRL